MTTKITPSALLLRRVMGVRVNHAFTAFRLRSDAASFAFRGSSMSNASPPSPVRVPPTDLAILKPPAVVMSSSSVLLTSLVANSLQYQVDSIRRRHSQDKAFARSCE